MRKIILLVILCFFIFKSEAQVGIGTKAPNSTAALEIQDTSRGLLIPRLTMMQRNKIVNPGEGLMVYQKDSIKGYWYFDGASWKNINNASNSNGGGQQILLLSDIITNVQAQEKITADYGPNTIEIRVEGCSNLTLLDLSEISPTHSIDILVKNNTALQTANFGKTSVCGTVSIINCPLLTTFDLHSLKRIIYSGEYVGLDIENTGLTSLNFISLISIPSVYIENNTALSAISFPALTTISDKGTENYISYNPNLSSLSFDNLTKLATNNFSFVKNKFPSTEINYLLHKLVSISPTIVNGFLSFDQQSPSAPPTGQGITDKNTLMANGNSVYTD